MKPEKAYEYLSKLDEALKSTEEELSRMSQQNHDWVGRLSEEAFYFGYDVNRRVIVRGVDELRSDVMVLRMKLKTVTKAAYEKLSSSKSEHPSTTRRWLFDADGKMREATLEECAEAEGLTPLEYIAKEEETEKQMWADNLQYKRAKEAQEYEADIGRSDDNE